MKNKSGFTLIELLAVIVIVSILVTVSIVVVDSIVKKSDTSINKIDKKNIEEATKMFVAENLNTTQKTSLTSGNQIEITYNDLVEAGLVSAKEKDVTIIIELPAGESLTPSNVNIFVSNILTLKKLILDTEQIQTQTPNYTTTSTDKGLFVQKDDVTRSINAQSTYYYRGSVVNNFLKFKSDSTNKLWRIMRINEDGTIRIITNSVASNINYGSVSVYSSSNVKPVVDNYYTALSEDIKSKTIAEPFCSEITTPAFGAIPRLTTTPKVPSFKCTSPMVTANAGLITADEVIYAGGLLSTSVTGNKTYLNNNTFYWTMTPGYIGMPYNLMSADLMYFSTLQAVGNMGVRPVINLKSTVMATYNGVGATGDPGTSTNPYIVE